MNSAERSVALDQAVKIASPGSTPDQILIVAKKFAAFVIGEAAAPADVKQPGPGTPTKTAEKATPAKEATKAAVTKPVVAKKPVKTEEQLAAETQAADEAEQEAEADAAGDDGAITLDTIKSLVTAMLDANKRKETKAMLSKYKANSASGVKEADWATFVEEANEVLMSA